MAIKPVRHKYSPPTAPPGLSKRAKKTWKAVKDSPVSRHYQPSDWDTALVYVQIVDQLYPDLLPGESRKAVSASILKEITQLTFNLGLTESGRRAMKLEQDDGLTDEMQEDIDNALNDFMQPLVENASFYEGEPGE